MREFVEACGEVLGEGDERGAWREVDGVGDGVVAGARAALLDDGGDAVECGVEARGEEGVVGRRGWWREEARRQVVDLVGGEDGERT